ncbi:MAG: ROK family protein [Clostridia bacterium]|nr:ROK family protein [Clostridia bacterium]
MNIGIDIGGNHVGMGIVNENGKIIVSDVFNYENRDANATDIFHAINHFIAENRDYSIESIGIGIPGIITGTRINYTCNLPIGNFDMKDYLDTELPIYLSNDARCATIAEYRLTDNHKYSNYALVTIGTGIGSGLIINGKLFSGTSGSAGEIGHTVIDKDGVPCKCGRRGCFEQYASTTALKRMTGLDSVKEIFYLSEKNDVIKRVLETYIENLSEGLANFINAFDIEKISIGGGLSRFGDRFIPELKEKISNKICNKYTSDINIGAATLRNEAGIIGASFLKEYLNV